MITAKLENGKTVRGALRGASIGLKLKMDRNEGELAEEVVNVAKDLVAVDTGATKEAIRAEQRRDGWAIVSDRGGDTPEVAVFLEFGTSRMAPRPYLAPAAEIILGNQSVIDTVRRNGGLL